MPRSIGTRTQQNFMHDHMDQGSDTRAHTRDVGMSKTVTDSLTFTASNGRITGSNGDFTAFAVGDPILVDGTNLNNGYFNVTGLDATNQSYLVVDVGVKNEGPISATVRTA